MASVELWVPHQKFDSPELARKASSWCLAIKTVVSRPGRVGGSGHPTDNAVELLVANTRSTDLQILKV